MTKENALFNEKLNFLINFRSVQINLHNGVREKSNADILKRGLVPLSWESHRLH